MPQEKEDKASYDKIKETLMAELRKTFRPEFLNRVDEIIVFHQLSKEDIEKIADIMIKELNDRLKENDIKLDFTPEAKEEIIKQGYDPNYGARPLRRVIQRIVENQLSELMLQGEVKPGDELIVTAKDGKIEFVKKDAIKKA